MHIFSLLKIRVLDLLAVLVKKGNASRLSSIFSTIYPWFTSNKVALQKKAFCILKEIMKRISDEAVADFFASCAEISNVLDQVDFSYVIIVVRFIKVVQIWYYRI